MTETQVRRVFGDLHRMHSGTSLDSATVRSYFDQWTKAKTGTVSESTRAAYEGVIRDFCEFLFNRADLQLLYVTKVDIAAFRDHLAASRSPATVNTSLKILRVAFRQAWRDGIIDDDPAAKVFLLKAPLSETPRRAFTVTELKTLLALPTGNGRAQFNSGSTPASGLATSPGCVGKMWIWTEIRSRSTLRKRVVAKSSRLWHRFENGSMAIAIHPSDQTGASSLLCWL